MKHCFICGYSKSDHKYMEVIIENCQTKKEKGVDICLFCQCNVDQDMEAIIKKCQQIENFD